MTVESLTKLAERLLSIPKLLPDNFNGAAGVATWMARRDTVFVEIGDGDGIVFATFIQPHIIAYIHIVIFRRRRLKTLDEDLSRLIKWAMKTYDLPVLAAWIPEFNAGARSLIQRLGFDFDGVLRNNMVYSGKPYDALVYTMSREVTDGRPTNTA